MVDGAGRAVGMIVAPEGEPGLKAIPGTALFTLDGGDSPDRGRCGKPAGPRVATTITGDAPATIRATLQRYFDGINTGDIDAVYAAFEPGVLKGSRSATEKGFRSTYDFTIRIRASQGPNAWVTFDSIFAEGQADREARRTPVPAGRGCSSSTRRTGAPGSAGWRTRGQRPALPPLLSARLLVVAPCVDQQLPTDCAQFGTRGGAAICWQVFWSSETGGCAGGGPQIAR